ncbi:MAG: hypothetical protein R3F62_27745 [Planctomycetota bacterium]
MSDETLRELERRWQATGAVEDEASYLLELVRVGALPQERLELASYCGRASAQRALGASGIPPVGEREWLLGLARFGALTCVRLAVLTARRHLPAWTREQPEVKEPAFMLDTLDRLQTLEDRPSVAEAFYSKYDSRNRYPYFMRDPWGFGTPGLPLSDAAVLAVGLVVGACNMFDEFDDEEGLEEWLGELENVPGLGEAIAELGRDALQRDV